MAERDLSSLLQKLRTPSAYTTTLSLLSQAKIALLKLHALTPREETPSAVLAQAREVYEIGALASIRAEDPDAFRRFYYQLTPFYELPAARLGPERSDRTKITGLYLLLLLTTGDYAGFHTELEGLQLRAVHDGDGRGAAVEDDRFLGYPIKLERWLMEGSYDLVWKAMEGGQSLPCEEYGVFSSILTSQIRNEIATCSEKAYPSLPISSTKNLLFLDSEGAVIQFAESRGWAVRDGRIYFPELPSSGGEGVDAKHTDVSQIAIENTLGYARELETIV